MDPKSTLRATTLELRRELEGKYDAQGNWQPGDLERRLASIGVRRDRPSVPVDELTLSADDHEARRVVDGFLQSRAEAGEGREAAIADFVREAAYSWANRLLALRCMEARGLIDEVILQKEAYGGRSLQHQRLARKEPERCSGEDEGLLAVLFDEFARRAKELPLLFDPKASQVALRPSVAALKRCVALLSGTLAVKGQEAATDEVFTAPDALGWTYQYWNAEEKDRVFEKVRTKKGKIEGAEIVPATCIYTEPYMVRFLVQNSLGAMWMAMNPGSRLCEGWAYYVHDADRAPVPKKSVSEITFLDPACGSGHFLIEAFELFYAMYLEERAITDPAKVCAAILERNLYGIDIDERAVQIAALALLMKAREKASDFLPRQVNLVATNIRLPANKEHLEAFLAKHPDDAPLNPALLAIFEGLAHADELGSLLQIEEHVERELRHLRDQQLTHERKAGAGTLFGPRKDEDWAAWKQEVIERVRQHFRAEAQEADLGAAFFGEAASKGLSLVDMLARRYDVVAANPPYMGSKNMGALLKRHVERHFASGKGDLYAAFILRCLELAAPSGRVGMVTQQSWMFLKSYADLRALGDEKMRRTPRAFGGMLRETVIETLAHLGPRAFAEIGGEVVNSALFAVARAKPSTQHRLTGFRLVGPKSAEEKDVLLRDAVGSLRSSTARRHPVISRPLQSRFLSIPQTPVCYWLRERFFEMLAGRTLGDVADVCQGLATADDTRFVRFVWEVPLDGWARPVTARRWVPFEKGGGYGKWFGHHFWTVEWEHDGRRMKQVTIERYGNAGKRIYNEHQYFKQGHTYSFMARGSVGLRDLAPIGIFGAGTAAGVMPKGTTESVSSATLNSRFSSFVVRSLSSKIQLNESYVARVPLPVRLPETLANLESACITLKRRLVALDLAERTFSYLPPTAADLSSAYECATEAASGIAAVLHGLEGRSEREVFAAYGIAGDDLTAVLDETGTPAGWFPLVSGYDEMPPLPEGIGIQETALESARREQRLGLSPHELADIKRRLRALYEGGPGAEVAEDDEETSPEEDHEEENDATGPGARIPIPTETLIEELSQKIEIHPVSVYWLLRELREKDGVICKPELVRFVVDYASVLVLRLLGHRWPLQVEAAEKVPDAADRDGIIPITESSSEPTLLVRVRERLAAHFGAARASTVERKFEEIVGRPFGLWLASDFFKRHISQFRKRPIAFQIVSSRGNNDRRRGRTAARATPAFSCLIYYHRLDADLLPKLRTQYVGPLRASSQTELSNLEKLMNRSADQDARRLELEEKLEELRAFDARLEQVIVEGFASSALEMLVAKEPLDKWTSRDGRARAPETRETLLAQEGRYDPDLNDGARVNMAPLQRAELLAADVLAAKDLEKAIADRAEWRADDRRWCREGKLPRPGWWPRAGQEGA